MSKTLNPTQRKWATTEREAWGIICAVIKFDRYLRGREFTVHTDHKSLLWMQTCTKGKLVRWATLLSEYKMTVMHKKGTELAVVDFMSRHPIPVPDPCHDRICMLNDSDQDAGITPINVTEIWSDTESEGLSDWSEANEKLDALQEAEWLEMLERAKSIGADYFRKQLKKLQKRREFKK